MVPQPVNLLTIASHAPTSHAQLRPLHDDPTVSDTRDHGIDMLKQWTTLESNIHNNIELIICFCFCVSAGRPYTICGPKTVTEVDVNRTVIFVAVFDRTVIFAKLIVTS